MQPMVMKSRIRNVIMSDAVVRNVDGEGELYRPWCETDDGIKHSSGPKKRYLEIFIISRRLLELSARIR